MLGQDGHAQGEEEVAPVGNVAEKTPADDDARRRVDENDDPRFKEYHGSRVEDPDRQLAKIALPLGVRAKGSVAANKRLKVEMNLAPVCNEGREVLRQRFD